MIKKIVSALLSIALFSMTTINSFANEKQYSIVEVMNVAQEICQEYGVTIELESADNGQLYSENEVNECLLRLKNELSESSSTNVIVPIQSSLFLTNRKIARPGLPIYLPNMMKVTYDYAATEYLANDIMSGANIIVRTTVEVNVQNGSIMNATTPTSETYGASLNFKSWTPKSSYATISPDRRSVTATVCGTLETEYTLIAQAKINMKKDHTIVKTFNAK